MSEVSEAKDTKKPEQNKKQASNRKILIAGIVVILLAVFGVGVFVWAQLAARQVDEGPTFGTGTVVIDDRNVNEMLDMIEKEKEGRYEVKMSVDWVIPDGKNSTEAYVANSEANTHPVFFEVTLDDGTLIYTSPLLPVGSAIDGVVLDTALASGTYTGVCTYHVLQSEEELTEIGTVSVAVRITV